MGTSLGLSLTSTIGFHGFSLGNDLNHHTGNHPNSFEMTDEMKRNYEVGLHVLKPTQKDLEHGLELHRNSLVFDTYGFMPRAAVDGAAIANAIDDSASGMDYRRRRIKIYPDFLSIGDQDVAPHL